MDDKLVKSEKQWSCEPTPEQCRVLRQRCTERHGSSAWPKRNR